MSSRRKGANTGNSSTVETRAYSLRDRTRDKGDVALTRLAYKNAVKETKDQPVKKNVKNKPTREPSRRDRKPVEPDSDNDSEDGPEDSDNSQGGLSENDRQSHFTPTKPSSGSSGKVQPSQPRKYIDDEADLSLRRPSIRSYDSAKTQPFQARQVMEDTEDVEEIKHDYKEVSWRGSTKTQPPPYSSEDDEEKTIQDRQKPKDELIKRTQYKEEFSAWRSPDHRAESGTRNRYQPKVNTETRPASSKKLISFSDGEEEEATRHQRTKASFPRQDKMNHNPKKDVEQKGNLSRKPVNNFFRRFAACMKYFVLALLVVLAVGLAALYYISPESVHRFTDQFLEGPEVKKDLNDDFEKLTRVFTNQSPLMWKRSRVILERHLENWKGNTEPAILLLTGAKDAEETLLCIGTQLSDIYSSSLSGNYTVISGSHWASGSNAEVKVYIDDHLSSCFQANTRAAVLHRLELLPSGSLLILYKYCDHESAVFKNVMLLFTVLLDDETLAKDIPLNDLEETVRTFLIKKLIVPHGEPSHDWMDHDKFSGVWSRISHVVLPVFPEENIPEQCVKKPI